MAKVDLDLTEWVPVSAGELSIDLLLRRPSDLQKLEVAEQMESARQQVRAQEGLDERGRPFKVRETTIIPDPGRVSRGIGMAIDTAVRDWRNVCDPKGVPIPYTPETLQQITAKYPDWGQALLKTVRAWFGLEGLAADESDPTPAPAGAPESSPAPA